MADELFILGTPVRFEESTVNGKTFVTGMCDYQAQNVQYMK
jgi:hypothetical protein